MSDRVVFCYLHCLQCFNSVICKLRAADLGSHIGTYFFGCLLYADDIMLVSHSLRDMQRMLNICAQELPNHYISGLSK